MCVIFLLFIYMLIVIICIKIIISFDPVEILKIFIMKKDLLNIFIKVLIKYINLYTFESTSIKSLFLKLDGRPRLSIKT